MNKRDYSAAGRPYSNKIANKIGRLEPHALDTMPAPSTSGITSSGLGSGGPRRTARAATWAAGLALSLGVGMLLYLLAANAIEDDARRRFDNVAQLARERVSAAIDSYARVVRSLSALHIAGDGPLTRLRLHR